MDERNRSNPPACHIEYYMAGRQRTAPVNRATVACEFGAAVYRNPWYSATLAKIATRGMVCLTRIACGFKGQRNRGMESLYSREDGAN
jgi:hypothetical protein